MSVNAQLETAIEAAWEARDAITPATTGEEQTLTQSSTYQLNDGNGIYIRGAGAGNVIRRNYIHDLLASTVMQSSIRTDGGQRDTLITENLRFND